MSEAEEIAAKLTEAQREFLIRVCDGLSLGHADRAEDRARQACRRMRLAHVVEQPRRWVALPLGHAVRAALKGTTRNA